MRVVVISPVSSPGGIATHTTEILKYLSKKKDVQIDVFDISVKNKKELLKRNIIVSKFILKSNGYYDIVHLHPTGFMGGFFLMFLMAIYKWILKYKFIITYHYDAKKLENYILKNPLFRIMFRFILFSTEFFIVVSKLQMHRIKKWFNIDNIIYIPNGFDPAKFTIIPKIKAKKMLGLPKNKHILFTLGVLEPYKGHIYLIEAIEKIKREDIICYIGGRGSLKKQLDKKIKTMNLENKIKLLGFVPDDQLVLWMNAADLFVLPSLSEGNPTVMFEALGVGLPFVGTAVGGVPEIITSEDYGLLCPPKDPECLAEKILIALEKDWDREKIRKYAEQFTWENIARKVEDIYIHAIRR